MTRMTPLLERNEQFARAYTPAALGVPAAQMLIVTCLDHRVDPAIVLGLQLGDAPVIRNAGGRVTQTVIDDIAYLAFLAGQLFGDQGAGDTRGPTPRPGRGWRSLRSRGPSTTLSAEPALTPTPAGGIRPPRRPASPRPRAKPPPSPTRTPPSAPTSSSCSPHPCSRRR